MLSWTARRDPQLILTDATTLCSRSETMATNRIVHFEIPAEQPELLTKFYADLFGWQFQKAPISGPEYWLCDTGSSGPGINGAVMQRQHPQQPWMNYVDVASIDVAIDRATSLGASVALPKTAVPGVGAYAAIVDPQGNICGLWERPNE
jgi:predicted enzyme related to lactoylglutathione lyase